MLVPKRENANIVFDQLFVTSFLFYFILEYIILIRALSGYYFDWQSLYQSRKPTLQNYMEIILLQCNELMLVIKDKIHKVVQINKGEIFV